MISDENLIELARNVTKPHKFSKDSWTGHVGCALVTDKGNIYLGANIDTPCGLGFCAEASAIASMLTNHEYHVKKIVAVSSRNGIIPPCGRCRELMHELDPKMETLVIVGKNKTMTLKSLLPVAWVRK